MLYGLFCFAVVMLSAWAVRDGYSPFASGGARAPFFFGHYGRYGPTHK